MFNVLSILVILVGLCAILGSLKILLKKGWLFGWFRGMGGIILVAVGLLLAFSALDMFSYKQIVAEESVATISFEELGPQRYNAVLADTEGRETQYELSGDQWQLDAKILKWPDWMLAIGVKPGYRLDRISGRYYSLEKERTGERTVYSLQKGDAIVDLWQTVNDAGVAMSWVDAIYGNATFVPMADGALYQVRISNTGLLARPLNPSAEAAVNQWD